MVCRRQSAVTGSSVLERNNLWRDGGQDVLETVPMSIKWCRAAVLKSVIRHFLSRKIAATQNISGECGKAAPCLAFSVACCCPGTLFYCVEGHESEQHGAAGCAGKIYRISVSYIVSCTSTETKKKFCENAIKTKPKKRKNSAFYCEFITIDILRARM